MEQWYNVMILLCENTTFQEGRLPGWHSGKESTCQCRRLRRWGFYPWVRKIPWRREWQPTPVFLPGECHGQSSLVCYSPWGYKESDMTSWLNNSNSVPPCPLIWNNRKNLKRSMDHQKAGVLKITGSKLKAWQQDMIIGLDDRVCPKRRWFQPVQGEQGITCKGKQVSLIPFLWPKQGYLRLM